MHVVKDDRSRALASEGRSQHKKKISGEPLILLGLKSKLGISHLQLRGEAKTVTKHIFILLPVQGWRTSESNGRREMLASQAFHRLNSNLSKCPERCMPASPAAARTSFDAELGS